MFYVATAIFRSFNEHVEGVCFTGIGVVKKGCKYTVATQLAAMFMGYAIIGVVVAYTAIGDWSYGFAIENAPRFSAVVEALRGTTTNTLVLSSGDNFLAGPEFNHSLATGIPYFEIVKPTLTQRFDPHSLSWLDEPVEAAG